MLKDAILNAHETFKTALQNLTNKKHAYIEIIRKFSNGLNLELRIACFARFFSKSFDGTSDS